MVIAIFCKYRGYSGTIETSNKDDLYHGKIEGVEKKITYEAKTFRELQLEFIKTVDRLIEERIKYIEKSQ